METLPIWGQFSIVAVLVGIIATVLILFFRGEITSRKQLDQVQKMADTWMHAYEMSEKKWEAVGPTLNNLVVTSDTILHIIQAAPKQGSSS